MSLIPLEQASFFLPIAARAPFWNLLSGGSVATAGASYALWHFPWSPSVIPAVVLSGLLGAYLYPSVFVTPLLSP